MILHMIVRRVLIDQVMAWFKVTVRPLTVVVDEIQIGDGIVNQLAMLSVMQITDMV